MPIFEPGAVVIVPFRFVDRDVVKRRPAVVVSGPALVVTYDLYWLCMVTSADNPPWPDDVPVTDIAAAGLPAPSVVRAVKLATVTSGMIVRGVGQLILPDLKAVLSILEKHQSR